MTLSRGQFLITEALLAARESHRLGLVPPLSPNQHPNLKFPNSHSLSCSHPLFYPQIIPLSYRWNDAHHTAFVLYCG